MSRPIREIKMRILYQFQPYLNLTKRIILNSGYTDLFRFFVLVTFFSVTLPVVTAREIKIELPEGADLSTQQQEDLKAQLRSAMRKDRKEFFIAGGNQYSVMATANCIEGYVQQANVKTSAPDVEIVSEKGVLCDTGGCEGWQVEAKRDSEALFDMEIRLQCSSEDWLVIEQGRE